MHLLSGPPAAQDPIAADSVPAAVDLSASELASIKAKLVRVETELSELKAVVAKICDELGIGR
jgi:hypothetical protein